MACRGDPRRWIHLEDAVWWLRHRVGHPRGILCGPFRRYYDKEIPRTLGEEVFSSPEPYIQRLSVRRGGLQAAQETGTFVVAYRRKPVPSPPAFRKEPAT